MELQPRHYEDRTAYLLRMGDPQTWTDSWHHDGRYLKGEQQRAVNERMQEHQAVIVGMALRRVPSKMIAAAMGVSRESIDRRLRPLGLKNEPGKVGAPLRRQTVADAA